jgi:hypothetical protein
MTAAWKVLFKISQVQAIYVGEYVRRMEFCNWILRAVHDHVPDLQLTFYADEALIHESGYINV